MANTQLVTTGITPLTVGSVERFQVQFYANGLPWFVDSATIYFKDSTGTITSFAMTVVGSAAYYDWTVPASPVGEWTRAYKGVKGSIIQKTRPIAMTTIDSP